MRQRYNLDNCLRFFPGNAYMRRPIARQRDVHGFPAIRDVSASRDAPANMCAQKCFHDLFSWIPHKQRFLLERNFNILTTRSIWHKSEISQENKTDKLQKAHIITYHLCIISNPLIEIKQI